VHGGEPYHCTLARASFGGYAPTGQPEPARSGQRPDAAQPRGSTGKSTRRVLQSHRAPPSIPYLMPQIEPRSRPSHGLRRRGGRLHAAGNFATLQPVRIEALAESARWLACTHAVDERRKAAPHDDAVGDADDVAVQRCAGASEERLGLAAAVEEEVGQVEEAEDAEADERERGVVPAILGRGHAQFESTVRDLADTEHPGWLGGAADSERAASKRDGRGGRGLWNKKRRGLLGSSKKVKRKQRGHVKV
jgi:hypothetical protein